MRSKLFRAKGSAIFDEYEKFEEDNDVLEIKEITNPNSGYPIIWVKYAPRNESCETKKCVDCKCDDNSDIPNVGDELEDGRVIAVNAKIALKKADGTYGSIFKNIKLR